MSDIGREISKVLLNWAIREPEVASSIGKSAEDAIAILNDVSGMTQAHGRDFQNSRPVFTLKDGTVLRTWRNPVRFDHVFLANDNGEMIFGGFVGWIHFSGLQEAIKRIRKECT